MRRLEETRGIAPQGLVASPDGRTLYYVDAGALYAVDTEKGASQNAAGGQRRRARRAGPGCSSSRSTSPTA